MKELESHLIHSPRYKTVVYDGAEHDFEGFEKQIVEEIIGFIKPQDK